MSSNPFRVVTIDVEGAIQETEWQSTDDTLLPQLQQGVGGGLVDVVHLTDDVNMWVNEEGLWLFGVNDVATSVARHFGFTHQPYYGPVVFTGGIDTEGATLPLSPDTASEVVAAGTAS